MVCKFIREGLRNQVWAIASLMTRSHGCKQSPVVQSGDNNGQPNTSSTYPYGNTNLTTTNNPFQTQFTTTTLITNTIPQNNAPQLEATTPAHRSQAALQVTHFNEQGSIASGQAWARSIAEFVQRSGQQR
jgi:hypothetical protein